MNGFTAAKLGWWIMATAVGALFTLGVNKSMGTDRIIGDVKTEVSQTKERTATLEEAVRTIKEDNMEIKKDIKEILRRTK